MSTSTPTGNESPRDPNEVVLVQPRYLAGDSCDDPWSAWARPMLDRGWSLLNDGHDVQLLISPCLRVRCAWLPEASFDDIQIAASVHPMSDPLWHIDLQSSAPTEFLVAVTTWVAQTLADNPGMVLSQGRAVRLPNPPGWQASSNGAISPDGHAYYVNGSQYSPRGQWEAPRGWQFTAITGYHDWTARFSPETPPALVCRFHAAVTDPAPLPRELGLLDYHRATGLVITRAAGAHAPTTAAAPPSGQAPSGARVQAARPSPHPAMPPVAPPSLGQVPGAPLGDGDRPRPSEPGPGPSHPR